MISTLLCLSALSLGPSFPPLPQPVPLDGSRSQLNAVQAPTAVVVTAGDSALRTRLQTAGVLRHDCGSFLVVNAGQQLVAALAGTGVEALQLEQLEGSEELLVVAWTPGESVRPLVQRGARVLFEHGDQVIVAAAAGTEENLHGLTRGRVFHGGLAHVRSQAMAAPASFTGTTLGMALATGNPRIQSAVNAVSATNLEQGVIDLAAIPTRCASGSGAITARNQLRTKLEAMGYTVNFQAIGGGYSENVVVELPGTTAPERIVVLGAHYDSIAGACSTTSPGADDNASGSSGVLEAARVLQAAGPFEHTIRFCWFSAEESGLVGSGVAAQQSANAGEDIIAMINTDMSSYRAAGDSLDVAFVNNNSTPSLISFCDAVGAQYVSGWVSKTGNLSAGTSDHQSYFAAGFPSIFFFEDTEQYSPYIHSSQDSHPLSSNDFQLSKMIVQGIVACVGTLAKPEDLSIAHTPLADSQVSGPFGVSCQVTSLVGSTVNLVELHYRPVGGAYTTVAMTAQGGSWVGQIPELGSPLNIEYYLSANDNQGNEELLPPVDGFGTDPFAFFVGTTTVHYFNDFEAAGDEGWTHAQVATQDDWQHGAPAGLAGDASSAFSGSSAWGNDLGIGNFNGEYQSNVENWLRSPVLDLSQTSQVTLAYRRWLTVEDAQFDQAQIRVNGNVVWENETSGGSAHTTDTSWVLHKLDISSIAAGNAAVQVEFRLISDGGLEFGGWTLDDFGLVTEEPAGCGGLSTYCSVSPNSVGLGALIGSNGLTSVGGNGFGLSVTDAPAQKPGLFFYGANQTAVPFGEGERCVAGALYRLSVLNTDVLGAANQIVDFNNVPTGGDILSGSTWNFQFWYRDPSGGPAGFNVSNALSVTFCP